MTCRRRSPGRRKCRCVPAAGGRGYCDSPYRGQGRDVDPIPLRQGGKGDKNKVRNRICPDFGGRPPVPIATGRSPQMRVPRGKRLRTRAASWAESASSAAWNGGSLCVTRARRAALNQNFPPVLLQILPADNDILHPTERSYLLFVDNKCCSILQLFPFTGMY